LAIGLSVKCVIFPLFLSKMPEQRPSLRLFISSMNRA
jgi:hypothetical protein